MGPMPAKLKWFFRGADRAAVAPPAARFALWTPVFLGLGIGVFFALPQDPPVWLGSGLVFGAALGLAVMGMVAGRWRPLAGVVCLALALASLGFAAAHQRVGALAGPVLMKDMGPLRVSGRIVALDPFSSGPRVVLDRLVLRDISPAETPRTVRLRLRGVQPRLAPGDEIEAFARLSPPAAPALPGGFDFQRHAFFKELGGVGFSLGPVTVIKRFGEEREASSEARELRSDLPIKIERVRLQIVDVVREVVPGPAGAVAAALLTGHRAAIPKPTLEAFRSAGLAHLLAISGLHIGLVAGLVFFSVRAALALIPGMALRFPIKKIAAVAALFAAFAYTHLAGATIPTQRAFLMMAVVLIAVLLDRRGISLRTLAVAASALLLVQPESLLSASFQMSFAAVLCLVAVYEKIARGPRHDSGRVRGDQGAVGRVLLFFGGVGLTTVVASLATTPFVLYHFNQVAHYGLLANLVAVPLTVFWIMPCAVASLLLMPAGLEALGLFPMGWALDHLIVFTHWISSLPGATGSYAGVSVYALAAVALGGCCVCLFRGAWRFAGVPALLFWGVATVTARPPDLLISGDAKLVMIRAAEGRFLVSNRTSARFVRSVWQQRAGAQSRVAVWPRDGLQTGDLRCDLQGCVLEREAKTLIFAESLGAAAEDCWHADILVTTQAFKRRCAAGTQDGETVIIDRLALWRNGAHAIWLKDGITIKNVRESRGNRPWVLPPARRAGPSIHTPVHTPLGFIRARHP